LAGKVAVITGGQSGIGREITAQLLRHGVAKVYILARSESKFHESIAEWVNKKGLKRSDVESRTEFVPCDLSSVHDVARAANDLLRKLDRLDILFNNAGKCATWSGMHVRCLRMHELMSVSSSSVSRLLIVSGRHREHLRRSTCRPFRPH
jgi:NAD(P)-dependent dehydrogenase (short-subunit alcohol dehydrogenase family)